MKTAVGGIAVFRVARRAQRKAGEAGARAVVGNAGTDRIRGPQCVQVVKA